MTPLVSELISLSGDIDFTWFDVGRVTTFSDMGSEAAIRHSPLPFEKCAVCGFDADGHKFLLLLISNEPVTLVTGWVLMATNYRAINSFAYINQNDELRVLPPSKDMPLPSREDFVGTLAIVGHFLQHVTPLTEGYRPTVKANSLTNQRRIAKGKPPLIYDWHTVIVGPSQAKQPHQGGTHATPRRHERRGHWRKLPSGKQVWVKNCWVGDASKGSVFKDYLVRKDDHE